MNLLRTTLATFVVICGAAAQPLLAQQATAPIAATELAADALGNVEARAKGGDIASAMVLYKLLLVGTGTAADWTRGVAFLEQAVEAGVPEAQVRLGDILVNAQFGQLRDLPRAQALYERAVAANDNNGRRSLANLLMSGQIPADPTRAVRLLQDAVDMGNIDAASQLAGIYARGQRVPVDADAAIGLYSLGVLSKNNGAIVGLGDLYRIPTLPEFDLAMAQALYRQAADAGDGNGVKRLADLMVKGEGMPADFAGGVQLLEDLVDRKDFSGLLTIGDYYQKGIGTPVDGQKAADYFQQAADLGVRDGFVRLAQLQRLGAPALPVDSVAALDNFSKAAELGDLNSARIAAEMTARGEGTAADLEAALAMLETAAAKGDPATLTLAGDFYSRGDVATWDAKKAIGYYNRAADAGQTGGLVRIAEIYRNGLPNFTAEPNKAVDFYQQAIDRGDFGARRSLADLLLNGANGVDPDTDRAVALLEEGTAAGDASAAQQLGNIYSNGKPLTADYDKAVAAFDQSIAAGNPGARVRKGVALLTGPLAEDHAADGLEVLQAAVADNVPGAPLELARVQFTGQAPDGTPEQALATLAPVLAANDASAIRYLIGIYRDGVTDRFEPDFAAAETLIADKSAVLGPEISALERAYVQLKADTSPDAYQNVLAALPALRPANAIAVVSRLFDTNQNGYVAFLQSYLTQQGLFSSSLSGTLNQATIDALMDFCDAKNIRKECGEGPLNRNVVNVVLRAMFVPAA